MDKINRPKIFYKYVPVQSWLADAFSGKSLLFSARSSFNDPFDCRPSFRLNQDGSARRSFIQGLRPTGLSPAKRLLRSQQTVRASKDKMLPMRQTQKILDEMGVLCLATEWDNALMWSHYANHHKGICIAFHGELDVFRLAQEVKYSDELPVIPWPNELGPEIFKQVFLTKARCWNYEKEWRIVRPSLSDEMRDFVYRNHCCSYSHEDALTLSDHRGPAVYKFSQAAIESVTMGMSITPDDQTSVFGAIAEAGLAVPIYKVNQPERTYALERRIVTAGL